MRYDCSEDDTMKNLLNFVTGLYATTLDAASQSAINSKVVREVLRFVIYFAMLMMCITLWQTFAFISAGKVTATVGTLLASIFALFGTILAVVIPAFVNALRATNAPPTPNPATPTVTVAPPTVINDPNGDNA